MPLFNIEKFLPVFNNLIYLFGILFFFGYWLYGFFILYHLSRFGIGTFPKKIAFIFILGSGILFFISVFALWAIKV